MTHLLDSNEAHVWIFSTDISPDECAEFREMLSSGERSRADRFVFESDRNRFIASHGMLRLCLGSCCEVRPESLVFGEGTHGKPSVFEPPTPIQFNLSHSGARAAIAVTRGLRCGMDIEELRTKLPDRSIAERFFCARENQWLQSLSAAQRTRGFFRLWSVKEAILKADGKGLSMPLVDVDTTSVLEGTSPHISLPDCDGRAVSLWVGELNVVEGYASALAIEAAAPKVRIRLVDPVVRFSPD